VELDKTQVAAEAAVGQGSVKVLREMQTYKKQNNYSPACCLFLLSNNVDLKNNKNNVDLDNNNRKYRKQFSVLRVRE